MKKKLLILSCRFILTTFEKGTSRNTIITTLRAYAHYDYTARAWVDVWTKGARNDTGTYNQPRRRLDTGFHELMVLYWLLFVFYVGQEVKAIGKTSWFYCTFELSHTNNFLVKTEMHQNINYMVKDFCRTYSF